MTEMLPKPINENAADSDAAWANRIPTKARQAAVGSVPTTDCDAAPGPLRDRDGHAAAGWHDAIKPLIPVAIQLARLFWILAPIVAFVVVLVMFVLTRDIRLLVAGMSTGALGGHLALSSTLLWDQETDPSASTPTGTTSGRRDGRPQVQATWATRRHLAKMGRRIGQLISARHPRRRRLPRR